MFTPTLKHYLVHSIPGGETTVDIWMVKMVDKDGHKYEPPVPKANKLSVYWHFRLDTVVSTVHDFYPELMDWVPDIEVGLLPEPISYEEFEKSIQGIYPQYCEDVEPK